MPLTAPLVIPRWEWRTFAASLASLRERLAGSLAGPGRESREVHVLCLRSSHNTRIRSGRVELRWRHQVRPDGLELWDPVLDATFPLKAAFVLRLFEAWGLPAPSLAREAYSEAQFVEEVISPCPDLVPVETALDIDDFTLDGTRCQLARVTAPGTRVETFSVEHEDPALVVQALGALGLDSRRNISVPMGLKSALGLAS